MMMQGFLSLDRLSWIVYANGCFWLAGLFSKKGNYNAIPSSLPESSLISPHESQGHATSFLPDLLEVYNT